MSFIEDAQYNWRLGLYKLGLVSTPPIVLPVDAKPELINEVKNVEDTYSRTNNIKTAFADSGKAITGFLSGTMIPLLILLIVTYFIFRKELKSA